MCIRALKLGALCLKLFHVVYLTHRLSHRSPGISELRATPLISIHWIGNARSDWVERSDVTGSYQAAIFTYPKHSVLM